MCSHVPVLCFLASFDEAGLVIRRSALTALVLEREGAGQGLMPGKKRVQVNFLFSTVFSENDYSRNYCFIFYERQRDYFFSRIV